MENVIIQFGSRELLARWIEALGSNGNRVLHHYRKEPWVSAQIKPELKQTLAREDGVKIVDDITLAPM